MIIPCFSRRRHRASDFFAKDVGPFRGIDYIAGDGVPAGGQTTVATVQNFGPTLLEGFGGLIVAWIRRGGIVGERGQPDVDELRQ